ncbi:MAG: response regulator transcription factor [Thermomicrobiales bacterium]|nr:response regulator transcription factor [Thermomicrobiales bacterium]MCO5221147.1 response regulator transcription factor [Thermomicrobiales bacterium]
MSDRTIEHNPGPGAITLPPADSGSILLVEDDPTLRSTTTYNLIRCGYRVTSAADGQSALREFDNKIDELDLVVLDLMLPEVSGLTVLRQIRSRSDVPVLIVSARGEEQDKIDGLELGADDYIVKPFALGEFIARVRSALRRRAIPPARTPSILHRGLLTIELESQRAHFQGVELSLSRKEFGLLRELALSPGLVFSRQQLLDAVWGTDIFVDERTIDVHMSWLRTKIRSVGGGDSMIRTVYGSGYAFEAPTA